MAKDYQTETLLAQIGNNSREEAHGAVSTPIYLSTAFRHEKLGHHHGYDYTRSSNPTRDVLEAALAKLEKGCRAFAASSGMAAIQLIFSLFKSGDHFIVSRDIYGGSYRLFEQFQAKYNFQFSYWDGIGFNELENLITSKTVAVFIESPTNPLMQTVDLKEISEITQKHRVLHIVDNTLATPLNQLPLELGADIVIHSATKYLAGHNDVLAGAVIAGDEDLGERLFDLHNSIGAVLSPIDCWQLIRGLKTLHLRMTQHEKNAKEIVEYLSSHPQIDKVYYPGNSGMVSFELEDEALVEPFLQALNIFTFAESLGGVESFLTYPTTQTHADIPETLRLSYGLSNRLIRGSIGIEHAADLIADLEQALEKIKVKVV